MEKACVRELCKTFNAFELAQYIQGEEELHFVVVSSNHDYKYGMHARWECQKNEVKSNQKLKMTWVETFMPSSGGFTGFKVPQKWPQGRKKKNYKVIDWWKGRRKRAQLFMRSRSEWEENRFPSTPVRLIPNGFGRGGFREAAYLAAEFAVLKAMQGENNKKRQQPSFTAERQRRKDIQNKRWIHRVGVKSQALKCAKSVLVILALTDISGSFLPPLLGKFLPLLWAHRVCSKKKKKLQFSLFILNRQ